MNEWLIMIGAMGTAALVAASLTDSAIALWHQWKDMNR